MFCAALLEGNMRRQFRRLVGGRAHWLCRRSESQACVARLLASTAAPASHCVRRCCCSGWPPRRCRRSSAGCPTGRAGGSGFAAPASRGGVDRRWHGIVADALVATQLQRLSEVCRRCRTTAASCCIRSITQQNPRIGDLDPDLRQLFRILPKYGGATRPKLRELPAGRCSRRTWIDYWRDQALAFMRNNPGQVLADVLRKSLDFFCRHRDSQ